MIFTVADLEEELHKGRGPEKDQQAFPDAEQQGSQGSWDLLQQVPGEEQIGVHARNDHEGHYQKVR